MPAIPILSGIAADATGDFRSRYPRNLVPVPKDTSIAKGYLRPAEGIVKTGLGPGQGRGGINWNGVLYRVMGSKLVKIGADGSVVPLGDVGGVGQVTLDYSYTSLGIASDGVLYFWDGTSLTHVTDPDMGKVNDAQYIAGYWMTTDGTNLVVTELNDPYSVNPLKYGSAESDPDPILAIDQLTNEAYAFGRYTIEVFQNVGGEVFPFSRIEGAQVKRGIIGTHAYAGLLDTWAFVGSGRKEAPAVYLMTSGATLKLSTREIDQVLLTYTEAQLATCLVESKIDKGHEFLRIHLPDQTLVYDASASKVTGEAVWHTLTSSVVGPAAYRGRNLVWVYDAWHLEDANSSALGRLVDDVSSHFGDTTGWEFSTTVLFNDGQGGIVHSLELIGLPGRVQFGADPKVWTSWSLDGETWSQERPIGAGKQGERQKRLQWRNQGSFNLMRIQRFRGTSDTHMSIARLEAQLEPLAN